MQTQDGGDLSANPGWDSHNLVASTPITEAIQDVFNNTNIQHVEKGNPRPTWISTQGHAGALDHFFVPQNSDKQPEAHVQYDVVFPSDHFPVILQIYSLKMKEPPSNITTTQRYRIPTHPSEA